MGEGGRISWVEVVAHSQTKAISCAPFDDGFH